MEDVSWNLAISRVNVPMPQMIQICQLSENSQEFSRNSSQSLQNKAWTLKQEYNECNYQKEEH